MGAIVIRRKWIHPPKYRVKRTIDGKYRVRLGRCTHVVSLGVWSQGRELDYCSPTIDNNLSCPHFSPHRRTGDEHPIHRRIVDDCIHILCARWSSGLRAKVDDEIKAAIWKSEYSSTRCSNCGSTKAIKMGIRHTEHGNVQRFRCKDCGFRFSPNQTKIKAQPQTVLALMEMHYRGMTAAQIVRHLRRNGIEVSPRAVAYWISGSVQNIKKHVNTIPRLDPNPHHVFRELEIGFSRAEVRDYAWAWDLMDEETKLAIASLLRRRMRLQRS